MNISPEAQHLVGLQGEPPLGVAEYVVHASLVDGGVALGVARVAGLQIAVGGLYAVAVDGVQAVEHAFQLVAFRHHGRGGAAHVGLLGRDGEPVDAWGDGARAVALHGQLEALGVEEGCKLRIHLQRGFAAREHGEARGPTGSLIHNLPSCHFCVIAKIGVAEWAAEVAAGEAHEHRGAARVAPLALQGVEYFVYSVHQSFS